MNIELISLDELDQEGNDLFEHNLQKEQKAQDELEDLFCNEHYPFD